MVLNNGQTKRGASPRTRRVFYGWYLVVASWLMTFLIYATSTAIFFKPILDEFGWDRATLSLVSSITMLVFAALSPLIGRLIDRFGPRLILAVSAGAQTLSSVFLGLASGLGGVYIGRFLYELKPTHATQVLINHWFIKKRGQALGILSTAIPLGQLVLSPVSQYLIIAWGWRETLYFWAALTAALAAPMIILARDRPENKGYLPDGELDIAENKPAGTPQSITAETGLSLRDALKSRAFWLLFPNHMVCGITCGLLLTHTVIFATDLGYSALIGASFLSIMGGIGLVGVLVTGFLSDRIPRHKVLSLTHFVRSLSILVLAVAVFAGGQSLWLLFVSIAFFGFGWFATSPLVGGLVADLFGNRSMGTILGLVLSSHIIGMAIGAYAGGLTFQLTGSYGAIFLAAGILEFIVCILAYLIKKPSGMRSSFLP